MKKLILIAACALFACSGSEAEPEKSTELRLVRAAGGKIALEIDRAPANVRALEVDLSIEGAGSFELVGAVAEEGLALDSVRIQMDGANRAILFVGAKREVLIPRAGRIATFEIRAIGGGASGQDGSARISLTRSVVASIDGARLEAVAGPSIAVR
jgi:hypothetical protein